MRLVYPIFLCLFLVSSATSSSQEIDIYDSGFRPEVDGFSFENYGNETKTADLTPIEMQRMFGEKVCATAAGGKCILSPPAEAWMEEANKAMQYGHCEGMAVLSALMYFNQISPSKFGGLEAEKLSIQNELLQREIAYWWVTQVTSPGGSRKVNESPNAVLETLIQAFKEGRRAKEWWTIGVFRPDGSGGHSVTPIAVENMSNGSARILVYDSNFPGATRSIEVDRIANTWKYHALSNLEDPLALYAGNASTQSLVGNFVPPKLELQRCDFCDDGNKSGPSSAKGVLAGKGRVQFWVNGSVHVLVTDDAGRRTGYLGPGDSVNEISDAEVIDIIYLNHFAAIHHEPLIIVPQKNRISALLTGYGHPDDLDLTQIGSNYDVRVKGLVLNPDEQVNLAMTTAEDDYYAKLAPINLDSPRSVTLVLGVNTPTESFWFTNVDSEIEEGGTLGLHLDSSKRTFTYETDNNGNPGRFELMIKRINRVTGKVQIFANDEYRLNKNDQITIFLNTYDGDSYDAEVLSGDKVGKITLQDNSNQHPAGRIFNLVLKCPLPC